MRKRSWLRLSLLTLSLLLSSQLPKPETAQAHHNVVHSTADAAVDRVVQPAAAVEQSSTETLSLISLGAVVAFEFTAFFGTQLVDQKR